MGFTVLGETSATVIFFLLTYHSLPSPFRYLEGSLYIIDVSQSVEHDHPHAMEFLRKDCLNVCEFFGKRAGSPVLQLRTLFELVVSDAAAVRTNVRTAMGDEILEQLANSFGDDPETMELHLVDLWLEHLLEQAVIRGEEQTEAELNENTIEEEVFKSIFIPRTLDDVMLLEKEMDRLARGEKLEYGAVTGIQGAQEESPAVVQVMGETVEPVQKAALPAQESIGVETAEKKDEQDSKSEDGSDDDSSGSDSDDEHAAGTKPSGPKRLEDKAAKKERKAQAKQEKREKRKSKIPKAVKKRKEKEASRR